MKKLLLAILISFAELASGQTQRLVLFEEFTQASCGPCAEMNPALNDMLNNYHDKVVSIKYQTYLPGIDPMNQHNPADVATRQTFYGVSGVPNAKLDGGIAFSGIPDNMDSSDIIQRSQTPASFSINVDYTFTPGMDTMICSADIVCSQSVTGNLVAHMVIIERDIYFEETPGTNDEVHFEGVMKKMLPGASGTTLQNSWNAGDSLHIQYSWALANVYEKKQLASVVFIQDTLTKEVLQAGYKLPSINYDLRVAQVDSVMPLQCVNFLSPLVKVQNKGNNTITSFDIEVYSNDTLISVNSVSGLLPTYHDTTVSLNLSNLSSAGHVFKFKCVNPNGNVDEITLNDSIRVPAVISTAILTTPFAENFNGGILPGSVATYNDGLDEASWEYSPYGNGTGGAIVLPLRGIDKFGTEDYIYIPKLDFTNVLNPQLSFDLAYAQYSSSLSEELFIEITTDCGSTWSPVYDKDGAVLATAAMTTSSFIPSAGQWRSEVVSLDSFAGLNEVLIRFHLHGRRGNNVYIDNISVNGSPTTVEDPVTFSGSIFPNPSNQYLMVHNLSGKITLTIYDSSNRKMRTEITHTGVEIDLSAFPSGIYYLQLADERLIRTRKFIIAH